MKILYKLPGQEPRSMIVPNKLEVLQQLVSGYIEHDAMYEYGERANYSILVNEEGKLLGLERNFKLYEDYIVGPAIFVRESGDEFTGVPEDAAKMIRQHFKEVEA
jgi:hypothetical protein